MNCGDFFWFSPVLHTRGHPYKLFVNCSRLNVGKHFFADRVVKIWNSLPFGIDDFRPLHK